MDDLIDNQTDTGGPLSNAARQHLRTAAKWARLLAILGFIGTGFIILAGLAIFGLSSLLDGSDMGIGSAFAPSFIGGAYLLIGGLYVLPLLYLYRFAEQADRAAAGYDSLALGEALRHLAAHYRFVGIMMLLLFGLYALLIAGMVLFGAF